jgi:hypothetical protein
MQIVNFRHQFHLHRTKVILFGLVLLSSVAHAQSFLWARKNNPNYDEKRKLSYGFLIGLHTTAYQAQYSKLFVTEEYDTIHSIEAAWRPGFSLGFLVNYRLHEVVDLRVTPTVSFYEHSLAYLYTDNTSTEQLVETTMVEFPFLIKYKSSRRGNIRMYMVGGFKPGIEASGKKDVKSSKASLEVKTVNLNIEAGIGFDLYFPLFKFSPEIRFSRGLMDVLDNKTNIYGAPLQRINTNTINVYLIFQ